MSRKRRKARLPGPRWLSTVEFARRWGISDRHVRKLIEAGIVPAIDVSLPGASRRAWRIPAGEGDRALMALSAARRGA